MSVFCLSDHYTVWTKSTIIELLQSIGDEEFLRSDSKEVLLERLGDYFVVDVLDVASLKALSQLADIVGIRLTTKKRKRDSLVSALQDFQGSMKDQACDLIQDAEDEELQRLLAIILGTDSETTQVFLESLAEELEDDEDDDGGPYDDWE